MAVSQLHSTAGFGRRIADWVFTAICLICVVVGLGFLAMVLWSLIKLGLPHINVALFTQNTPPAGETGGLLNAIVGTLIITSLSMLMAAPIGILIATYMVEFKGKGRLANVVRFINDVLLSAPSIILGLFVYALIVQAMGHFSALAGSVSLAIIAIPMIVRTTEGVLALQPAQMREAAVALGVPRWQVTVRILWRASVGGIITAVLLATARVTGETAPLLFTALSNSFFSLDVTHPMANLPVVIFNFAMSPYETWQNLAWAGALLITVSILAMSIIARLIFKSK